MGGNVIPGLGSLRVKLWRELPDVSVDDRAVCG